MSNFLKKEYSLINNIFCCNINDKSTQKVTNFYKETPFPNYKKKQLSKLRNKYQINFEQD